TSLPFEAKIFDTAMSMHTAMNIENKEKLFSEARRVLKATGTFGIYDVLQGEGGEVLYPVPWAREPSISFLSSPNEMAHHLQKAGFKILKTQDTTSSSQQWFEELAKKLQSGLKPPVTFAVFLGEDFQEMAQNQIRNLKERRILTRSYICKISNGV
ncbi:MAG TPA: methyltransferase domain-containing protein, partial [Candidatus Limnocylindrales bacterium]|nr:methyltransferase domain-containing protein [Candidatus Limnocylindrales bacterium]